MSRAEAVQQAIHLMGDAQAVLDGAGADVAAAHLDLAIQCAEDFLRRVTAADQAAPK